MGLNGRVGEKIGGDEGNEILIKMKCIKLFLIKLTNELNNLPEKRPKKKH